MPCFTPLKAWASITQKNPKSGKRYISFRKKEWYGGTEQIQVKCSSCEGCKIERARQWAVRCWHEASLYDENNTFITLTFAPACPLDGTKTDPTVSLHKHHFQRFMKRLRKEFGQGVRYFHCGEYGEKYARPHHHACLFNFTFKDKYPHKVRNGNMTYRSPTLERLWPWGISEIGELTFKSAAYVARYILKKTKKAKFYYEHQDKIQEYNTMSRRPGIAKKWFLKYYLSDVLPTDSVTMDTGHKVLPPKYYDRHFELTNPEEFALLKQKRIDRAKADPNNTPERLASRHDILKRKLTKLERGYEKNDT